MASTAKLIDVLASTLTDSNGDPLSGYQVRTYASDGTTAAAVWEDRAKSLPDAGGKSQFNLSTTGNIEVYGDNTYVIKLWTPTATPGVDDPYDTIGPSTYSFDLVGSIIGDVYASDGTTKVFESGTNGTDAEFPEGFGTDTIREETAAAGVTIDGVLCKDNAITASGGVTADLTGDVAGNADTATLTTFRGCYVYLTGNQAISNAADATIDFSAANSTELYDTSSFHDPSTNSTRLTIPANISRVQIIAAANFAANSTGYRYIYIKKNGSILSPGSNAAVVPPTIDCSFQYDTGVIDVVAGNYFEMVVQQSSGAPLNAQGATASATTWINLRVVE